MNLAARWHEYRRHWRKGAFTVVITTLAVLASVICTIPVLVAADILGYSLDDGPALLCWAGVALIFVPYFLGRELWRSEMIDLYTAATAPEEKKK